MKRDEIRWVGAAEGGAVGGAALKCSHHRNAGSAARQMSSGSCGCSFSHYFSFLGGIESRPSAEMRTGEVRCHPMLEMRLLGVSVWRLGHWAPELWMLMVTRAPGAYWSQIEVSSTVVCFC